MAKTFDTRALSVHAPNDPYLAFATVHIPEGASQTFAANSPVKFASGYVVEWVSVADADILGLATTAGNNGTAGANDVEVVQALQGIAWEANLLAAAAANYVLLVTERGAEVGLTKSATLLGASSPGWYFEESGTGALIVTQFIASPIMFNDRVDYPPVAGDTNARVRAHVKPGVSLFF